MVVGFAIRVVKEGKGRQIALGPAGISPLQSIRSRGLAQKGENG